MRITVLKKIIHVEPAKYVNGKCQLNFSYIVYFGFL